MLAKHFILVLLPAVAYSRISIKILASENGKDPEIQVNGEEITDLTPEDINTFKLDDETLKRGSKNAHGKRCSDVYLKTSTPHGNVFKKYNWTPVKKVTKPVEAVVIGMITKPTAFGNAEYVNNHNNISVTYTTSLSHEVEETVSHSWSKGGEVGIGLAIDYSVNFGVGSAGGTTSFSYTANFGEETSKARSVVLGTTSSIQTVVPPKTKVVASLLTTHGTMQIEVTYVSYVTGVVFCNYSDKFKGHHFYGYYVERLLQSVHIPSNRYSVEDISVGFYSNARLEVNNGDYEKN